MHARVATFEGEQSQLQKAVESIREQSQSGPPEGVPATEFLVLQGRDTGKVLAITFFESEDDLRQGDETLNAMSPPQGAEGMGKRTSVEKFDVAIQMKP
jgi:hypothetical protein